MKIFRTAPIATALAVAGLLAATMSGAQLREPAVADRYAELDRSDAATAQQWFELAQQAREAGEPQIAADSLERAVAAGISPVRAGFEQARQQVVAGEPGLAVAALKALSDGGYNGVTAVTGDPVLATLAGNPDYDALIATMTRQAFPCRYDDAFRSFDFWLGDWDVRLANGQFAGTNRITSEESGCVLVEHWNGAGGSTGMSVNYLDKATGEWVQVWNSQGGGQISIRGGLTDEGMRLVGQIHYVGNGTTAPFRGLWTPLPDGRVRQYFEQSNDGGATWTPWFEGYYSRRSATETER